MKRNACQQIRPGQPLPPQSRETQNRETRVIRDQIDDGAGTDGTRPPHRAQHARLCATHAAAPKRPAQQRLGRPSCYVVIPNPHAFWGRPRQGEGHVDMVLRPVLSIFFSPIAVPSVDGEP
jgi:hypothetical protein